MGSARTFPSEIDKNWCRNLVLFSIGLYFGGESKIHIIFTENVKKSNFQSYFDQKFSKFALDF